MPCGAESGRAIASASGQERTGARVEGAPFGEGHPPDQARRLITDVVNRSVVEIDSPKDCP